MMKLIATLVNGDKKVVLDEWGPGIQNKLGRIQEKPWRFVGFKKYKKRTNLDSFQADAVEIILYNKIVTLEVVDDYSEDPEYGYCTLWADGLPKQNTVSSGGDSGALLPALFLLGF